MNTIRFTPSVTSTSRGTNLSPQVKNAGVRFGGSPEILYALGSALNEAQYAATKPMNVETHLANLRTYLDTATQDEAFPHFINRFKDFLGQSTRSLPSGISTNYTLGEISNYTRYFKKDNLTVRAKGFKLFQEEFIRTVRDKMLYGADPAMPQFWAFTNAIKPSIGENEKFTKRQLTKFNRIMNE